MSCDSPFAFFSVQVDAALFVFSFLPLAFSSSDVTTKLLSSSSLPLFSSPLPRYMRHHAALLSDIESQLSSLNSSSSSPPPVVYPRRIHQVDWTSTVALLLGLPIPFSSLGSVILDLIPSLSSFVPICKTLTQSSSSSSFPSPPPPSSLSSHLSSSSSSVSLSLSYRCNDLLYATQLQHIAAWHQRRSIDVYAKTAKSFAVVEDQTVRDRWLDVLRIFERLQSLREKLPLSFHQTLHLYDEEKEQVEAEGQTSERESFSLHEEEERMMESASSRSKDVHEKPLSPSSFSVSSSLDVKDLVREILEASQAYLSACTEFSQAVFNASKRQFSTFDEKYIFLGILLAILTSCLLLSMYFFLLNPSVLGRKEEKEKEKEEEEGERKKMMRKREEEEDECEKLRGESLVTMIENNGEGEESEKKENKATDVEKEEPEETERRRRRRWGDSDKSFNNSGREEETHHSCKGEEIKQGSYSSEKRSSSSVLRQREVYILSFLEHIWNRYVVRGYSRYGVGMLLCIFLFSDCYCVREHAAGRFLLSLGLLVAFAIPLLSIYFFSSFSAIEEARRGDRGTEEEKEEEEEAREERSQSKRGNDKKGKGEEELSLSSSSSSSGRGGEGYDGAMCLPGTDTKKKERERERKMIFLK